MNIKIDENNEKTYVVSKLNGKKYTRITHTHVKKYNMTLDEYCKTFNVRRRDTVCDELRSRLSWTEENAKKTYGDEIGTIKWKEYCDKQAFTNTFEYKHKKYNWTQDDFERYNKNRSSTYENYIKRHGKEKGEHKWQQYCKRQSYAGSSLEYFIELYGDIVGRQTWENVCKSKANTIDQFMRRHGIEEGKKRWLSYIDVRCNYYSNTSQELFKELHKYTTNSVYYATLNKEYCVACKNGVFFYDYVDTDEKKCIEFNGDVFHGNPNKYLKDDCPNPYMPTLTCESIWNADMIKIKSLEDERNIKTLVVWESDYKNDSLYTINKCKEFLNYE